jgi:GTP-binding protein EngB required for normal cell division
MQKYFYFLFQNKTIEVKLKERSSIGKASLINKYSKAKGIQEKRECLLGWS